MKLKINNISERRTGIDLTSVEEIQFQRKRFKAEYKRPLISCGDCIFNFNSDCPCVDKVLLCKPGTMFRGNTIKYTTVTSVKFKEIEK
jgi:hypothetical protein